MLTALQIKNAKPGKHFDGGGLYLQVMPNGARYWRMKYRYGGKESRLSFGSCKVVPLAEARRRRDDAHELLREGRDPATERKAAKDTKRQNKEAAFPIAAAAWLAYKRKEWAPETYRKAQYITDTYLTPTLKRHSITILSTKQAADALESIASKAPSLAAKARQYLGGIVTYAIRQGLREDGRLLSLRGAVPKHAKGNIPAATDPKEVTALLHAIDAYPTPVMRAALTLAMLTAMRPGLVAAARWVDIDLNAAEWSIPAPMMKTRHAHIVPLPSQALIVLREMLAYTTGHEYVFPPLARQRSEHLSRDAMSNALRRMGFQGRHATHGFRGMLRTVARERLGIDSDVLEAQLAHAKKGEVQKAYDRTTFNDERRRVMQVWADYLDNLRVGGKVIPIKRRTG
ncbi:MAG: integrase arm-type DNA-binding domain-containing protein [Gammaproteobacteria bacterium]